VTLELTQERIQIAQGGTAMIGLKGKLSPIESHPPSIEVLNLPEGLSFESRWADNGEVSIQLSASAQLPVKPLNDVYVEASLGHRRVSSRPFVISVSPKEAGH
jgi:hypothetical protein